MRIAIALAAAMSAAAARGSDARFVSPRLGQKLEPGSLIEVSWSLDGLGREPDEMELVLSLDGGATFPIRVTVNLDPSTNRLLWRVPVLPTREARLALRTGFDEEPSEETIQIVGPVFSILAGDRAPLEELFGIRSEWRTREALGGAPAPLRKDSSLSAREEFLSASADEIFARQTPRVDTLTVPASFAPKPIASPPAPRKQDPLPAPRSSLIPLRE